MQILSNTIYFCLEPLETEEKSSTREKRETANDYAVLGGALLSIRNTVFGIRVLILRAVRLSG